MTLSTNMISGLASGFDWRTMVDQLIAIDHRRVDLVENSKSDYESQLSEWQSFNTKLLALKTASEALKDPEDFYVYTANMTSNNSSYDAEDLLSVSASTSAATGTYTIKVESLAAAQKLSSNPFTSKTAELGSAYAGEILINGQVITIGATDSLSDVASTINSANTGSEPLGVTASVVSYGTNDYRLILTSDTTGADGIGLLNGGADNLVQQFGWKDLAGAGTEVIKNSITNGAQSDRFSNANTAAYSLLGLSATRSASVTIDGTAVTIDLSKSLTEIKEDINTAVATVTASVVSETVDGTMYYRLQIEGGSGFGTAADDFIDTDNLLNTLGIIDHTSEAVTGKVSGNELTTDGAVISASTLLTDIDGYNTFTPGGSPAGDFITLSGTDTAGGAVAAAAFDISTSTTVQDLLDEIESRFGDVIAYVTSDGKIRVDDLTGGASLAVNLASTIQDGDSSLTFVDGGGNFAAADERIREIVEGADALIEVDGVDITDSSNTIDDVITGVTLNLLQAQDQTTITLNIAHDVDTIKTNISDFVDQYNSVISYINTQFDYDEEEQSTGGVLFGDGTLSSVKSDLISLLTDTVWGVDADFSALSLVGINVDNDLVLTIDDTILSGYLTTNFSDVMALFAGQGTTSTSSLSYVGHGRDSAAGLYAVQIDRAATRGTETGSVDLTAGGVTETLTISEGNGTAAVSITAGMTLDDIENAINEEMDREYAEVLVGDQALTAGGSAITASTKWTDIDGTAWNDGDVISFTGTSRSGGTVSGSYEVETASDVSTNTVQAFLSAIEDAFSSKVSATIDSSGRLVVSDIYNGYSQLSIATITEPVGSGLDFGAVDVTAGAGDGSQEGRYAMSITATDDGSGHLVLRSDDYGSADFTISQDNDSYYDIVHTATANTTASTGGNVYVTSATTWSDIYGAGVADNDTITISGTARDGVTAISSSYTASDISTDTIGGLLAAIETEFTAHGNTVDAFIRDGKIYVEDRTATGASAISLTLTANNQGGGSLSLGTFDQSTERDLDLGLINGTVSGQDVAGTINGESATGSGQVLTGDDGNVKTDGISVRYTGSSNDVEAGTIRLTLGVAEMFERTLYNITDTIDGYVAFKQDSLQGRIDDLETKIGEMEDRLDQKTVMLINRFVQMELMLSQLQNQSQWLTGQISSAAAAWK
ncbi:MAG: flagellar hook protein [Desulfobacteraceae bacterium]|nr:MAG: flagellar hook protein [Desulfobacteraceae bacterium]